MVLFFWTGIAHLCSTFIAADSNLSNAVTELNMELFQRGKRKDQAVAGVKINLDTLQPNQEVFHSFIVVLFKLIELTTSAFPSASFLFFKKIDSAVV